MRLKTRERRDVTEVFRNSIPEISDGNKNGSTSNCNEPKTVVCFEGIRQIKACRSGVLRRGK